jgi:hypothetical protein
VPQHGFDLLWVDLLAAGVDAHRAASEQVNRAVGIDRRHVAGQRPTLAVDLHKGSRAALGIVVVPDRHAPGRGEAPNLARTRRDRPELVVDHHRLRLRRERERRGRRARSGGDRDGLGR